MKVISLFSGCGGADLGFEQAGIRVSEAFDTDPVAVASYNCNVRNCAFERDVRSISVFPENIDILIATPPCQGFSTASGYRKEDDRNNLFLTACRAVEIAKSKVAVIENVAGIINRRNRPLLDQGIAFLRNAGYHVEIVVLPCDKHGVAQRRKRVFVIARSGGRSFVSDDLLRKTSEMPGLKDIFGGLDAGINAHDPVFPVRDSRHERIARAIGPGQKLCNVRAGVNSVPTWDIPDVFGVTTEKERRLLESVRVLRRRIRKRDSGDFDPISVMDLNAELGFDAGSLVDGLLEKGYLREMGTCLDLANTFNGKYRRIDIEGVSPTVDTRFGDCALFLHPLENRGMTVREAARIQGFPDSFLFDGPSRHSFRLIGNAVPPPVAAHIAAFVRGLV